MNDEIFVPAEDRELVVVATDWVFEVPGEIREIKVQDDGSAR